MLIIKKVEENGGDLNVIRNLFVEYGNELNEDLCFQSFDDEIQNPLKKYGPPNGCMLLAYWDNEAAGCVALQQIEPQTSCEMKRLYVRPQFRNLSIADQLVKALLEEAEERGYKRMVLDTLQRLHPAIKLYLRHGFMNTAAYYQNPLPDVVYMEKKLV